MSELAYEIVDKKYCVKENENKYDVLNIGDFSPELVNYYKALLAHKRDLDYAKAYLSQMFFSKDTTLIDSALINSAIQLLIKCFSSTKDSGRRSLDSKKVFTSYAKKLGKEDLYVQFGQFYNARNTVIAHDQINHSENLIGITVEKSNGTAVDISGITIRTTYLYQKNKELLDKLIEIAYQYVEDQMTKVEQKIILMYNHSNPKPSLAYLYCSDIKITSSW